MSIMSDSEKKSKQAYPSKKRLRNPSEWQREKRKRLRVAGKEYINSKGHTVDAKTMGEDCRCRRKCFLNVSEENRRKLFHGYYSLKNHDEQNAYLFSLIRRLNIARKRSKNSDRRSCTYKYFLRLKTGELQVCRLAFANIHGISPHKIRILCQKLERNVMFPNDERGKHNNRPKKITSVVLKSIKDHIYSTVASDKVREFLKEIRSTGAELNITKMWKDYLKNYDPHFEDYSSSFSGTRNHEMNNNTLSIAKPLHEFVSDDQYEQNCSHSNDICTHNLQHKVSSCDENNFENIYENIGVVDLTAHNQNSSHDSSELLDNIDQESGDHGKEISGSHKPIVKHWLYSRVFHEEFNFHDYSLLKKRLLEKLKTVPESSIKVQQKSVRKQRLPKKIPQGKEMVTGDIHSKPPNEEVSTVACSSEPSHFPCPDNACHLPSSVHSQTPNFTNVHGWHDAAEATARMMTNLSLPLVEEHPLPLFAQRHSLTQDPHHVPFNQCFTSNGTTCANYQTSQAPISLMLTNLPGNLNISSQYFDASDNFYE